MEKETIIDIGRHRGGKGEDLEVVLEARYRYKYLTLVGNKKNGRRNRNLLVILKVRGESAVDTIFRRLTIARRRLVGDTGVALVAGEETQTSEEIVGYLFEGDAM